MEYRRGSHSESVSHEAAGIDLAGIDLAVATAAFVGGSRTFKIEEVGAMIGGSRFRQLSQQTISPTYVTQPCGCGLTVSLGTAHVALPPP